MTKSDPKLEIVAPTDFRAARQHNLAALRAAGIEPFAPNSFAVSAKAAALQTKYQAIENGTVTEDRAAVAGRIMSYRNSGMFIDVMDDSGKIQIFSDKKTLPENLLAELALLDLGDWIGVEGIIRRTPRGELTINLEKLTVLGKAMTPPPEKFHGLQDVDTRYRHREYDLASNEDSRKTLRARFEIIRALRNFMDARGFLEVETPMLHVIPGGANAKPFTTHHNTLGMDLYLRIAPELHLKRLIIGGLADRVYEINRCFRNEGISTRHNPEFTTLESYEAFTDYHGVMKLAEEAIEAVAQKVFGKTEFEFRGHTINIQAPFRRARMTDLVKEATGIDFLKLHNFADAKMAAGKYGIDVHLCANWGQVVEAAFAEKVEDTLVQPTHVTDLPKDISPLAQGHREQPLLTERFETFIGGWEFCNGFSELSDPAEQRARFDAQTAQREAGDDEAQYLDEDFIHALELGLPATGGLGIGIDRLAMLLTGSETIREVIAFPTMRPKA
jgi:lysyl-tRNA synthetase class 2